MTNIEDIGDRQPLYKEIAKLRKLLYEVLSSQPQDNGLAYVEVQVGRDVWREAIALLGKDAPWPLTEVQP